MTLEEEYIAACAERDAFYDKYAGSSGYFLLENYSMQYDAMKKHCEELEKKLKNSSNENDPVSNPSHYTYGNIEVIDFIDSCGYGKYFCLGNAIKYIARCEHKGSELQDLKKARWYLDHVIKMLEETNK